MPTPNKKFSWSFSRLKNYRTCPKRHYHVDIQKDFKEEQGDAILWGNSVHDALAKRVGKGTPLPRTMEHYEPWAAKLEALKAKGFDVLVEQKLAMSEEFKPTSFFDGRTWFRAVVDVLAINKDAGAALAFDWKTGAIKPDYEQLALSAQVIFVHHPEIQEIATAYIWLADDQETLERYRPGGITPTWQQVLPTVREMAEAHRTVTYPPRPSGLCKRYCPVTSCPHHGKGSY